MKNKRFNLFIILCILLCQLGFFLKPEKVFAIENNSSDNTEEYILEENSEKLKSLYDYINKIKGDNEAIGNINPEELINNYIEKGESGIELNDIITLILNILFKEIKVVLKLMLSVLTVAILCSLLKNLQDAFKNESISNIAFFACYSILIVILSRSLLISIGVATDVIKNICDFMAVLLPVLVSMIAISGGIVQAATMDPLVLGAVALIPKIYKTVIIPLILIHCALQFANNISEEHKIDNLCKLTKQTVLLLQGIIITFFIGLLTIRGITADTMDAVALKTTKFAVDNFIPIVGKAFSDAITSVAGYSLIIKNAISGLGLTVILLIILYPIIKLISMTYIYKISAALIEPISDKRITSSISAVGDSMTLLLSCVISVSFMFFILLGIIAQASKFVVGG